MQTLFSYQNNNLATLRRLSLCLLTLLILTGVLTASHVHITNDDLSECSFCLQTGSQATTSHATLLIATIINSVLPSPAPIIVIDTLPSFIAIRGPPSIFYS